MNELMIFEEHEVEVFEWNGKVLFNPYHVGGCLELGDSAVRKAIGNMNEKQVIKLTNLDVKKGDIRKLNNAGENFLTESGVYKLVFKSHKPNAEKFTDWIADEVLPTLRKTGTYEMPKQKKEDKTDRTQIMLMNARSRVANTYLKLANVDTLSPTYKSILVAKTTEALSGEELIPLPKIEQKTYNEGEIGEKLGISSNMVGRLANKHNLKIEKYGCYVRDKKKHCEGECDTWRYYDTVIPVFKNILNMEVA